MLEEKKELNFDINRFKNFKNKINYIVVENEPDDLIKINNNEETKNSIFRKNAQKEFTTKEKQF